MKVRFHPQIWINDYAHDAYPLGATEWTPSDLVSLLHGYPDVMDALRYEPWFDYDEECPDWIKSWDGPWWIEVLDLDW